MRLIQLFCETVARNPEKTALITEKSQLSFAELLGLARILEARLMERGLRQGMRVVLDADRPEFQLAFALVLSRRSLTVIFAKAAQVIEAGVAFDLVVCAASLALVPPARQIVIEADWFADLGTGDAGDFAEAFGAGGHFVHSSSGTTGRPKFIISDEARQLHSVAGRGPVLDGEALAGMRMLTSVSTRMSWALLTVLRVLVGGGSAVVLSEHRNRPLQYIDLYRVSFFMTTPAVARQMLEVDTAAQYLTSLRAVRIGGAACSPELLRNLMGLSGARIVVGYGAAEFGELCTASLEPNEEIREGYIGEISRPDFEIAFFDDRMQPKPDATEGIVGFRDPRPKGGRAYLNPVEGDGSTGYIGGYFFPGDIMRREGQSLFLIGRVKNIINVSGNKISLDAVQAVLEDALAVNAIACLAVSDDLGLEKLAVVYAGADDIAPEAVQALLDARFAPLQLDRMLRKSALPIGLSGKIDVMALREELP
ncbi:MAG: acyl--CoA ligase [Rhodobacteraceae bacterium]|nr:acyl--CoA ligase [Paracoccaceae bacterium]